MANAEHEAELRRGVASWNAWRDESNSAPVDLSGLDLERVKLDGCNLLRADLRGTNLRSAQLTNTHLKSADLTSAIIEGANFEHANAREAVFDDVRGRGARFMVATLRRASFRGADLRNADFYRSYLRDVRFENANLTDVRLGKTYLEDADFQSANLTNVDLRGASLVRTSFDDANLSNAQVYGVATWGISVEGARQDRLVISRHEKEAPVFVDDLASAHLVSMMMENDGPRAMLSSVASKLVLVLGRFSEDRKPILDLAREALRESGYAGVIFDFERPRGSGFIEVIQTLAGLCRFVVADLTDARVVHQEIGTILQDFPSVPVRPILAAGHDVPTTIREHALRPAFIRPVHVYRDAEHLLASLPSEVIAPAEARAQEFEDILTGAMQDSFTTPPDDDD